MTEQFFIEIKFIQQLGISWNAKFFESPTTSAYKFCFK